ncbi:integrase [Thermoproteota archaeon]
MNPSTRLGNSRCVDSNSVSFIDKRKEFIEYLQVNGYYDTTVEDVLRYLDKYPVSFREPQDVISLFCKVKRAKRHVILAIRLLLNFHETLGFDKYYLDRFRNAIPKVRCGIDLKIPSETQIIDSLGKLEDSPIKYKGLYNLLTDSGLRLVEAVHLINCFRGADKINGFYRCVVGEFRGNKQAYYGHFSEKTLQSIKDVNEELNPRTASHYYPKMGYVSAKYIRKFVFDKMIELEIPESIADFIQGRVPQRVGAKHYMALARQASKYYPRYLDYIENLRRG